MINIVKKFVFIACLFLSLPVMTFAQRDWVFVGPRAVGMGSAYLAVSNNAEAVYWNPAALARMEHFHFTFGYGDFYKVNFKSYYASTVFNFPLGRRVADYFTFGLDWLGLQDSSQSRSEIDNQFHAALGIKPFKSLPTLSFGVSANLNHKDDWNVSALYSLPFVPFKSWGRLSVGAMFFNRYGTPETRPINHKNILKDHHFRYGLSYQLFKNVGPVWNPLIAIDYGERLHQGLEIKVRLMDRLTALIRFGLQKDLKNREKMTQSFGITLNWNFGGLYTKSLMTPIPPVAVEERSAEMGQPEVCFHFARTNSPQWNSCYQYGVAAVIQATDIPVPASAASGICPSSITLNWMGSQENYEDGYIILRDKVNPNVKYWFLKGLGWRDNTYCDVKLNKGNYNYQIVAYKDNIDPPLKISSACRTSVATTGVDWLCNLSILHNSKTINLTFGMAATAADNLETAFCEQQLAAAQAYVFDARFASQSLIDIRANTSTTVTWTINLQPDQDQEPFVLTWDKSTLQKIGLVELKIYSDVNNRTLKMQDTSQAIIDEDETVNKLEITFIKAAEE